MHGEEKCPFIEDNQLEEVKRLTKREKVRLLIVAYAASMEEELTCSVCFELFVVRTHAPKEFYCAHVICEICMKPLLSSGQSQQLEFGRRLSASSEEIQCYS